MKSGLARSSSCHSPGPAILPSSVLQSALKMAYKLPQQALYAFQLPPDLLHALQPRQLVIPDSHPLHPANRTDHLDSAPTTDTLDPPPAPSTARTSGNNYTCALTGASFPTLDGLKHHYRTDWYRYNVKLRLEGKKTPVSEDDFNRLVESASPLSLPLSSSAPRPSRRPP